MKTYISILRGINVSGQRIIKMDALNKMYSNLQFSNVKTYIQSGNVVFQARKENPGLLASKIIDQIKKQFNFEVPVIVLESDELQRIIKTNPFLNDETKNPAFMHVTFLSKEPLHVEFERIKQKQTVGEEFHIGIREVYLYCPGGYGQTKLTNSFFENVFKVEATTRNWKTTCELNNLALQSEGPI